MLVVYIKIVYSKLSPKIIDIYDNKKLLYVASRLLLDPLVFSFLSEDEYIIENEVMLRFEYYNNNEFFKEYQTLLSNCDLKSVNVDEFKDILKKIIDIGKKSPVIEKIHNSNFEAGKLKIPSVNTLKLEQIINEVIELEVSIKLNPKEKIDDLIKNNEMNISEDVVKLFKNNKPQRQLKDYGTNLVRFMNFNKSEILDKYKDEFLDYVKSLKLNNFDYEKYSLEEMSENIIRGIYVWNESESKEDKYTKFFAECENTLNKDMIISKIKSTKELPIEDMPWFESLNF